MMTGFLLTVVIAAILGWIGDSMARNNMPGGFWGALLAGLVGSWIGAYMPAVNKLGPTIGDIPIVSTILGSIAFIFALGLFKAVAKQAR